MAFGRLLKNVGDAFVFPLTIFCDNVQTIRLVTNAGERINTKLKHVDIQNLWLRQEFQAGSFAIEYLPTDEMPADGLTKCLSRQKFEHFIKLINLQDARHKITGLPKNNASWDASSRGSSPPAQA